uniref:LRAT domain-containing protein n=1 Tax=Malurus cyaneus samueli TaxID=2593467 RepID=A0A8C5U4M7_9PASS
MKLGKRYPNPGDMIKIKMLLFHHWALYVGGGYVVPVTSADEKATLLRASTVTTLTRKAKVKKELLKEVARRYDWNVNNNYDWYRVPLPVEEIVRHAESWIGKEVPYDMLRSNCRHFVTMLRYGKGSLSSFTFPLQVTKAVAGTTAVVGGMMLVGLATLVVNGFSGDTSKKGRKKYYH